jgi:hypothetical protein
MNAGQMIRRLAVFFMSQTQKENSRLPSKQPYGNGINPWLQQNIPQKSRNLRSGVLYLSVQVIICAEMAGFTLDFVINNQ